MSEDNNKDIIIKTKINKKDMFEFMISNNYRSFAGKLSLLFSLICIVGAIFYWNKFDNNMERIVIVFFSLMFTVISPIEYYIRAARQVKKAFKDELTYIINEDGIEIQIKELSSFMKWEEAYKVVSTKNLVAVYSSIVNAFIIPKRDIADKFDEIKKIMEENTKCYKFSMK